MVSSKGYHGQFFLTLFSTTGYYFILIVEIFYLSLQCNN
nr:MAG TPA: hypothetical protein [Caudoviricetes sp.]